MTIKKTIDVLYRESPKHPDHHKTDLGEYPYIPVIMVQDLLDLTEDPELGESAKKIIGSLAGLTLKDRFHIDNVIALRGKKQS